MYWQNWASLCLPKTMGGLGFQDPGKLNQALLAKVAWRIFNNPNLLISQVLLAKYSKVRKFLDVTPLSGCSWR